MCFHIRLGEYHSGEFRLDVAVSNTVQKQLDEFRAEFREDINRLSEKLVAVEKDQAEAKKMKDQMGKKQEEMKTIVICRGNNTE